MPLQRLAQYVYLLRQLRGCTAGPETMEGTALTNLIHQLEELTWRLESELGEVNYSPPLPTSTSSEAIDSTDRPAESMQRYEGWNVLLLGDDSHANKNCLQHWLAAIPEDTKDLHSEVAKTGVPAFRNYVVSQIIDPPLLEASEGSCSLSFQWRDLNLL